MKELLRTTTAYRTIAGYAKAGELPHATLVVFPDGKYLRALLTECAKAYFSADERVLRLVQEERYPDCIFLPAAGGRLTADDCARIVDESVLRPMEADKKLFVLDAFHTATPLIQNKLLKLLEEPPAGVYFLLGATAEFSVLPTILSRVRKLTEPPFSEEAVASALERMRGSEEGIARAAAASGGVVSLAEMLLDGGEVFRLAEQFLREENLEELCRSLDKSAEKKTFFAAVRLYLRDALLHQQGFSRFASLGEREVSGIDVPAGALVSAMELVSEAERNTEFNANFSQAAYALALGIREEKLKWQKLS